MSLKPSELIPACIDIIGTFEPAKTTVDSHHTAYCARHRITDPVDAKFLHQVVYGCQRYKRMLKVFLSSFYYNHSGEAARSDQSLYTVLAYLAILRLEELTFEQFKRLVLSQDFVKTRVFLKFLFNEESLTKWLKEGWLTLYEPHYVQSELIDQLLKFEPDVRLLVDELDKRQAMGEAKKAAEAESALALAEGRGGTGKFTTPEPFNLTRPAPRLVPEPTQTVPLTHEAARVGADFHAREWKRPEGVPRDQLELDKKKEANRLELGRKYADASAGRFQLLAEKRPTHLEAVRSEQEARIAAEHPFHPTAAKPVPKWDADQGFVKLNAAAILREEQVYRRKQELEVRQLRAFEEELSDTFKHDTWLAGMRAHEELERKETLEKRRIEALLSEELAKAATEAAKQGKRALAARQRMEAAAVAQQQDKAREADALVRQAQVAAVAETHKNGGLAVAEVERRRREIAEGVREEGKALEAERRRAMAEEEERRQEVIRQIRALELVPSKRERVLDPTYEPGHGLLEEMSLAELRERLALNRTREAQEVASKRAEIVRSKQQHGEDLAGRMSSNATYRQMGAAEAEAARARERAAKLAKTEADLARKQQAALEVEETRKALREKAQKAEAALAADLRRIAIETQFLGSNASAAEVTKFECLTQGARREALSVQREAVDDGRRQTLVKERELAQRQKLLAASAHADAERTRAQSLRLTNAAFDASLAARQTAEAKKALAAAERANKARVHAAYAETYPYSEAINQQRREHLQQPRGSTSRQSLGASAVSSGGLRLGNTRELAGTGTRTGSAQSQESRPMPTGRANSRGQLEALTAMAR